MVSAYWIRRFLLAYLAALVIIAGGQLLRGRPFDYAIGHGLLWALVTAGIYTAALAHRRRRCALCRDGN